MGYRANFVTIRDGQTSIYYAWWGAGSLLGSLLYGPEWTIDYFESQELTPGFIGPIGCQAGAIVDEDARRLLFFHENFPPSIVRPYIQLVERSWPGWEVRWADQGLFDLAYYLGSDPAQMIDDLSRFRDSHLVAKKLADIPEFVLTVITIGSAGDAIDYGFMEFWNEVLARGPDLVELLQGRAKTTLADDEEIDGTAFINPIQKEIWVCEYGGLTDLELSWIAEFWPGWTVRRHNGGLRKHVELTGRDASPFTIDEKEALRRIMNFLSEEGPFQPPDSLKDILKV
jgi:hypothetical protein